MMPRLSFTAAIATISLIPWLSGCTQPQATAPTPTPSASSSSGGASSGATSGTQLPPTTGKKTAGFEALTEVVSKTRTAAKSGDFKAALTEYEKFEESWAKVEDGVKAKSPKVYDQVEDAMGAVEKALKAAQPPAVESALQSLDRAVTSAAAL